MKIRQLLKLILAALSGAMLAWLIFLGIYIITPAIDAAVSDLTFKLNLFLLLKRLGTPEDIELARALRDTFLVNLRFHILYFLEMRDRGSIFL